MQWAIPFNKHTPPIEVLGYPGGLIQLKTQRGQRDWNGERGIYRGVVIFETFSKNMNIHGRIGKKNRNIQRVKSNPCPKKYIKTFVHLRAIK